MYIWLHILLTVYSITAHVLYCHVITEGYTLQNVSLNESGVEREVNYLWKFQIMVKYGPLELGGLEVGLGWL